ncbi:MAG: hypothetical protein ACYTBZ_28030, partial [Planctomycetota bacterium]
MSKSPDYWENKLDEINTPNMNDHTNSTPAPPIPVRFWWLKRTAVVVAILIVILTGLRWWWGKKAHQALQAEIDRIKATGQPLYPQDFVPDPLPDNQNAALILKKAVAALKLTDEQNDLIRDLCKNPQDINKYSKEIKEFVDANAEARKLVRAAQSLPAADWKVPPPSYKVLLPSLALDMKLIRLLNITALDQHNQGNDAAAIEILRDIIAYGRHIESMRTLIATLVDCSCSRLIIPSIQDISQTLTITDKTAKSPGREQIQALINELLDEKDLHQGLVWGFYRDRAWQFQVVRIATGKYSGWKFFINPTPVSQIWARPSYFLTKPTLYLDGVKILQQATANVEAVAAPNWPEIRKRLPPPLVRQRGLKGSSRFLSHLLLSDLNRAIELTFEQMAHRRMAAITLAIRLYELDNGKLPEKLDDLVPKYIPAIPQDPFAKKGQKIEYYYDTKNLVLQSIGPEDQNDPTKRKSITFPL